MRCTVTRVLAKVICGMQMVLKCADIGHLAAAPRTHRRWAFQLEEEFFRQVTLLCLARSYHISCANYAACTIVFRLRFPEQMVGKASASV